MRRRDDVEEEADGGKDEETVVEGEVLDVEGERRQDGVRRRVDAEDGQDARVPELGTLEARDGKHCDDEEDALDGAGEGRQEERPRVKLFPRGEVEVHVGRDERRDGPPRQAEVERRRREETRQRRVQRVAAMVKELAELWKENSPSVLVSL